MKKLLIIGDDIHSIRYITSIIYNDKIDLYILDLNEKTKEIINHYKIKKISKEDNINNFDYILYTLPNQFNNNIFDILKNYKNILLLEKPQCNLSLIKKLKSKIYFIHLRYYDKQPNASIKNNNQIIWPNLNKEGMDQIINTLPNIIDYLISINKKDEILIDKVKNNKDSIEVSFRINSKAFITKIINTDDLDMLPKINNYMIKWPNYFLCISELIEDLLNNKLDYKESIKKEEKIVYLIEKIRGEINGY